MRNAGEDADRIFEHVRDASPFEALPRGFEHFERIAQPVAALALKIPRAAYRNIGAGREGRAEDRAHVSGWSPRADIAPDVMNVSVNTIAADDEFGR